MCACRISIVRSRAPPPVVVHDSSAGVARDFPADLTDFRHLPFLRNPRGGGSISVSGRSPQHDHRLSPHRRALRRYRRSGRADFFLGYGNPPLLPNESSGRNRESQSFIIKLANPPIRHEVESQENFRKSQNRHSHSRFLTARLRSPFFAAI